MKVLTTQRRYPTWQVLMVIAGTLLLAALAGMRASWQVAVLLGIAFGVTILLLQPRFAPMTLVLVALVAPLQLNTGTEVAINPTTLLVPALMAVWLLSMVVHKELAFVHSRVNLPLLLFLFSGLLSLIIGQATWDTFVPQSSSFILVQLAQWAIFAFSAGAFWMAANLVTDEIWLRRLLFTFIALAAVIGFVRCIPSAYGFVTKAFTFAVFRPPFWILLAALAGGQLLFNRDLSRPVQIILASIVVMTLVLAFIVERETLSYWAGILVTLAVLLWFRIKHSRWLLLVLILLVVVVGQAIPRTYEFAGGESEWAESGGSRLVLAQRAISVTMRNPITGLGPAAYRPYARMEPLPYLDAFWVSPNVSSHNNYVDIFSHTGIIGLGLFIWFIVSYFSLALRVRSRQLSGLSAGYVNGVIAAVAGSLVIMLLADWILPFVYNISFQGFQASVLVWLMMGGVLALDHLSAQAVDQRIGVTERG
jgi:O-antigen ligase